MQEKQKWLEDEGRPSSAPTASVTRLLVHLPAEAFAAASLERSVHRRRCVRHGDGDAAHHLRIPVHPSLSMPVLGLLPLLLLRMSSAQPVASRGHTAPCALVGMLSTVALSATLGSAAAADADGDFCR